MLRTFLFPTVILLAMGACDSPTHPSGPYLAGEVTMYDEDGHPVSPANDVTVSALSPSSVRQYLAHTDNNGSFEVEIPDTETVDLLFERDGFGQMFRYGIPRDGGPVEVDMFAQSSGAVTSMTAEAYPCGSVNCLRLTLAVDNFFATEAHRRLFRIFLSTDPGMSYYDYELTSLLIVPDTQPGIVRSGDNATFELEGITGLVGAFPAGTTVYAAAHGATENSGTGYTQPGSTLEIYTDLSPVPATTSFIIP